MNPGRLLVYLVRTLVGVAVIAPFWFWKGGVLELGYFLDFLDTQVFRRLMAMDLVVFIPMTAVVASIYPQTAILKSSIQGGQPDPRLIKQYRDFYELCVTLSPGLRARAGR